MAKLEAHTITVDAEINKDVNWPDGVTCYVKATNKFYTLESGAFSLIGGGSTIANIYETLTAKYFLASPTGSTGEPTFRVIDAADVPTLNQNTTGSAAKWTTARSLAGNSVDGTADVAFANKFIVQGTTDAGLSQAQFLGALTTGIVKNTTTTGILSIATAGTDYSVPSGIENFTGAKTFGAAGAVGKLIIAGNTSGTTILNAAATAGASTLTLQAIDGTIYSTGGTDVSLADGGTGASLSDPAAHTLMGWDNTDNAVCFITIGENLTYTQATHTLSASAAGGGATTALDNLASVAINLTLVSDTDNTDALGTAAISWSDLFLGSGSIITWSTAPSTADVTLTHSANTLTFAGGNVVDLGATTATTFNGLTITANGTNTLNITAGKSLIVQDNVTISGALGTGAYATIANYATLANPTFTGTVILPKTLEIQDTSADHQYVLAVSELTADRTITLPLLTGTDTFVFQAHTQTLTNKRVTQRVVTTTDDATAVIDVDVTDVYELSAVANATTFSTTGTPTDGQKLIIRFKDAGVAKGLTWDAIFVAIGVTAPTTTVAGKWHYVGCQYNTAA
ncbi:MAG: hypothetical protein WC479_11405, partial [Candidatus Izemoplasmatales bacterium]